MPTLMEEAPVSSPQVALDKEAIEAQFQRDGYVLVPGAISKERVQEIRKGIAERINNQSSGVFQQPAELLQKVYSQ